MARKKVRWGHLYEIEKIRRIGDAEYNASPARLKHLASWRRMHAVAANGHASVQMSGTRLGVRPSSNMTIKQKNKFIRRREQ